MNPHPPSTPATTDGFVAGTLIHTKEGLRPIEDIQVGDWVFCRPEEGKGEPEYRQVVNTFEYDEEALWYVYWPMVGRWKLFRPSVSIKQMIRF
jgi:hypothetical protein